MTRLVCWGVWIILFGGGSGAALAQGEVKKAAEELRTTAFDILDKDTVTVKFGKGVSTVTSDERGQLAALVKAAAKEGDIERVVVAAWADEEYPGGKGEKLPESAKELAKARADNVEAALASTGVKRIEKHSMAEGPSWIAKTFNTRDAQVKGEGKPDDVEARVVESVGRRLYELGGPGSAVVIVRTTAKAVAH